MRRLILTLALILMPTAIAAQPASLSDPMQPFARLVGEWRGSGWMTQRDGTRAEFESRETVTPRLSGAALLVEGRHSRPGAPDNLVHDAIAMLTWDSRANAHRFRTALASNIGGDYPIELRDGGFVWYMDTPDGRIEHVITLTDERWHERGRRALANGEWADFFEMTLTRQR